MEWDELNASMAPNKYRTHDASAIRDGSHSFLALEFAPNKGKREGTGGNGGMGEEEGVTKIIACVRSTSRGCK